ncbi:PREDICTED: uncharacterized protein LOC109229818 [Nicotiana attenuata]|uniref:uncharacterized protein LOC109229818 n=1 Tax=Nicotiana attenuata TaxID=49451 RepID=UPI0009050C5A|nr:PREDICTED: uncharacterized protein LOC109229818 [Nicotiana attenuata]
MYIELAKILQKRYVNIACVQETRWVGSKARDADEYKLWYYGVLKSKNIVGILVDRDLRESVVEVRRVKLMAIKLVLGEYTLNVVSAYALQTNLDEEVKRSFWEGLDEIVRSISPAESEVHGGFSFGDRNRRGTSLLDFAKAFELVIANSIFPKREEYLVTFQSAAARERKSRNLDQVRCIKDEDGRVLEGDDKIKRR